jgi:hypothetical protein
MVIQSKREVINNNIKIVLKYLDSNFPCCWDDLETDIATGMTDIHKEIINMRSALGVLKFYHKDDKMQMTICNKCLQLLAKER